MQSGDGNQGNAALQKPSVEELRQKLEWLACKQEAGGGRGGKEGEKLLLATEGKPNAN